MRQLHTQLTPIKVDGVNTPASTAIIDGSAYIFDTTDMYYAGVMVSATVNSTAKNANYGVLATLILQDLTYTAVASAGGLNSAGNAITIAYTGGGTAGAEVVTVVGSAISVQIETGVSTATQVNTALTSAGAPVSSLVTHTVSGTGATAQVIVSATHLAGGVDSKFVEASNQIIISSHGFTTGQVVQATTSAGSLPTGISTSTNYFVYVVDANTIALFDTLAHALAATSSTSTGVIVVTADGTAGAHAILTPTAVSGVSYKLQESYDYDPRQGTGTWHDAVAGQTNTVVTNTITTTAVSQATLINTLAKYVRVIFAVSAGSVFVVVVAAAKGA